MLKIKTLASGSNGNCLAVSDEKSMLLLDCGIPFKQIQKKLDFQLSRVEGVLITHQHLDHCRAIANMAKAGINCYIGQSTMESIGITGHRIKVIHAKQQITIGPWTVLPFPVVHDVETFGFLMTNRDEAKVLCLTDTMFCPYKFNGLTHILLEINHSLDILQANVAKGTVSVELKNRITKTHMNIETAKNFLKTNDLTKVQEIHLVHLSDGNSDEERFKKEIMELTGKPVYIA